MLIISRKQMEAFRPTADEAFVVRLVEYLMQNHADASVQIPNGTFTVAQILDENLQEMARNGIARAREYGMSWESSLTAFVVLMFVVAPNFDKHPLINRGLRDDNLEANSRIEQLWNRTSEDNWQAAKENYDASAWSLKTKER